MAKAFAPANISCIFAVCEHKNPARAGSIGVGFTLEEGVIVSVRKKLTKKPIVFFNNQKVRFPVVESVAEKMKVANVEIRISSKLPLGAGFGISGASALASAYALNKLAGAKKTKKQAAKIAHAAEVENKTGLGDVVNQFYGGFLLKTKPSSEFKVERLPIRKGFIYYKVFGGLDTKKVITNKKIKDNINTAGIKAVKKIKSLKKPSLKEIIRISKEFAINSGLVGDKKITALIKKIEKNNGSASMMMLGNAVFSDKEFEGCKKVKMSNKRARLL
jgi:pantoate kinase